MEPADRPPNDPRPNSAAGHLAAAVPADLFHRAWWAMALRGLAAIVLGVVIISRPGATLRVLLAMVGLYVFVDGVLTLVTAFHAARERRSWWPYVLEGVLSVGIGLYVLARPATAAFMLLILIAARAIVVGVVEIGTGLAVRRTTGSSAWMLWLGGLASVAFGLLLFASPGFGTLTLIWMIGVYTIAFGLMLDADAFRLRGLRHRHDLAAHTT